MATKLIDANVIKEFKGLTSNLREPKDLDPHILEAQNFELRNFIGESFYLAIVADAPGFSTYGDLWNGVKYTYNGMEFEHEGLRAILAYHSYARYTAEGGVQSTPSGFAHKKMQYSEKADPATINRMVKQARAGATAHEKRVEAFLDRNRTDYPLWKCGDGGKFRKGTKKFRKV